MPRKTTTTKTTDEKLTALRQIWQDRRKKHWISNAVNLKTMALAEIDNPPNQQVEHCCCCGNYSLYYYSMQVKCHSCDLVYQSTSLLEFMELLQSNVYQHQSQCNGQVLFSFHEETGLFMACTDCDEISFL